MENGVCSVAAFALCAEPLDEVCTGGVAAFVLRAGAPEDCEGKVAAARTLRGVVVLSTLAGICIDAGAVGAGAFSRVVEKPHTPTPIDAAANAAIPAFNNNATPPAAAGA